MHTIQTVLLPLLFSWLFVGGTFWLLGLLPIPRPARMVALTERWGSLELDQMGGSSLVQLVLISAIGLFLEPMLIRWVSSEIRIFAYFKNLVLVACFFGFGLGCYLSRRRIQMLYLTVPLLAFVVLFNLPWSGLNHFLLQLSDYVGGLADVHVFGRNYQVGARLYLGALVAFSVVIPLTGLVMLTMVPVGQMVSRCLERSEKGITAYSANVAASIVGIWVFTGICFLSSPPVVWFALLGASLILCFWKINPVRTGIAVVFALICGLLLLVRAPGDYRPEVWYGVPTAVAKLQVVESKIHWSPYQKLTLTALSDGQERQRFVLNTNGSWYQEIMNLSLDYVEKHPQYYQEMMPARINLPFHRYNLPYRFVPPPESVLILGSGMGNDVAAALRNGAKRVVAVEIDALIVRLGSENHPEHPYSDPRVEVVVDDARSYIQNSNEQFDLIVSSILDSHITQSSFTNIRTDNYVYTHEGIEQMQRLLKPNGVLSLSFNSERRWFAGRIRDVLTQTFGHSPLMINVGANLFLVEKGDGTLELAVANAGSDTVSILRGNGLRARLGQDANLLAFVDAHPITHFEAASPTTDDWPYFYSRTRGIPLIVVLLSLFLIGVCWGVMRKAGMAIRSLRWHFFFLGAGFMLMEVQIISKMALLFGTTWLINSIAITALLVLVLLANGVVAGWPELAGRIAYPGLFIALAFCYFVPLQVLLVRGWIQRAFLASLALCLPVFFAGLIFTRSFQKAGFQAEALGSNLFGALVGGLLEVLSFWTGLRALLLVGAACYLLAALVQQRGAIVQQVPAHSGGAG